MWFNSIPGCLFALDANSEVFNRGASVKCSNDPSIILNSTVGNLVTSICTAHVVDGYSLPSEEPSTFKCLTVNGSPLRFNNAIQVPQKFTLFLVVSIKSKSSFAVINGVERLMYRRDLIWESGNRYLNDTDNITIQVSHASHPVQTVATTRDIGIFGNKEFYIGSHTGPMSSIGMYDIYADIIAYGLFNSELTKDQINSLRSAVHNEFLIKTGTTVISDKGVHTIQMGSGVSVGEAQSLEFIKPLRGIVKLEDGWNGKDIKIKKYTKIKDHVYEEDEPIATKLFLLHRDTGVRIATTYSNPDGSFEFTVDDAGEYMVVAPHLQKQFRAIAKDYL